ncbi:MULTISPECIES: SDR family NAD(P)-dependent oxidoreductase [unclassified Aureimonas]|uniref:SDR family NAD(P)-dependent oxidoreductase n=1 Tax=unclassified Aureimonas TaxID=2615206 RepID=UPI0006FA1A9F|nr:MULTISPECIES: SDR family NAD(P)-dependent oxidoreductase [unclassified Aureimonas]KQT66026.1 3-oxoacyl-ACP reductase [Aureimonas sp. Leaf427]KQT73384.1 3-oxoacyl-ACP reductase [Aureimonas sp. Leaf460]
MTARFEGRRAIVTGGASGIGLTVARRLAAEGAKVAIFDRDAAKAEEAAASVGGLAVPLDITDWPAVEAGAKTVAEAFGGIDILVASAGITGPNTTLADYPPDAWRQVFDVNVHGLFHCNKAVVPFMVSGAYGRIVNIASVAGKEGNPNASAYSASKAAVIGLTKSLGKELAKTGITVNCVTPAAVKTAIFDQMQQSHIDFMLSKIPMGRFGTVDEVTSLVTWLASEECSFTTSAVFDISGGRATY